LNADLFDWARTLAANLPAGSPTAPPFPTVATDASVASLIAAYQDDLATALELDLGSTQPKVPSAGLPGDPVAFLLAILTAAVPSLGAKGLLFVSVGLVALGTLRLVAPETPNGSPLKGLEFPRPRSMPSMGVMSYPYGCLQRALAPYHRKFFPGTGSKPRMEACFPFRDLLGRRSSANK